MKTEDLKIGKELQKRIENIEAKIKKLNSKNKTIDITIRIIDTGNLCMEKGSNYTEKANTNIEYLNQLYRDNVLRTLEDCKQELEKEFELLGTEKDIEFDDLSK